MTRRDQITLTIDQESLATLQELPRELRALKETIIDLQAQIKPNRKIWLNKKEVQSQLGVSRYKLEALIKNEYITVRKAVDQRCFHIDDVVAFEKAVLSEK